MAITGISALSGQQIIASGACSARSAATASYTTGGNDIQGLYTTVNSNSGNWNTPLFPDNITADSLYIENNGDITLLQKTGDDSDDFAQMTIRGSGIEFINGQTDPTVVGTIAGNDISNWNSTYNTVSTNSASWTGGGGGGGDYISAKGFTQRITNTANNKFLSFWNEAGGSTATAYPAIYLSGQFASAYYKDNELKIGRNGHSIAFNIGGQGPKISAAATGNIASFMYVYNTGASATIAQSSFNLSNSTASEDITIAKIQQWNSAYDQLGNVTALLDSL